MRYYFRIAACLQLALLDFLALLVVEVVLIEPRQIKSSARKLSPLDNSNLSLKVANDGKVLRKNRYYAMGRRYGVG